MSRPRTRFGGPDGLGGQAVAEAEENLQLSEGPIIVTVGPGRAHPAVQSLLKELEK
ncbi:hypothetical protein [Actinomadura xylanilytica]|nr:hypothetical protein [Actinomadura xylanilytica]MDL4777856.1 hypothetical protein [Actinomadura xylanilytica]